MYIIYYVYACIICHMHAHHCILTEYYLKCTYMLLTPIAHIITTPGSLGSSVELLNQHRFPPNVWATAGKGKPFPRVRNVSRNDAILRKLDKTWNVVQLFKATIRSQAGNQTSGIAKHFNEWDAVKVLQCAVTSLDTDHF